MHIDVDNIVSPNFKTIFKDMIERNHYMYVLKGGRNSGKSVEIGEAIILGVMKEKKSAAVMMQYKADLGSKVVNNMTFCINNLGLSRFWKLRKSPYEYILLDKYGKETDVSIRFYGCDNVQDTKGFKSRIGEGFLYTWFEEANRFSNWEVIQSIIDTCDRLTGHKTSIILSYNPPKNKRAWINDKFNYPIGKANGYKYNMGVKTSTFEKAGKIISKDILVHHSTLEDLVECGRADWVSDGIYAAAMESKEHNPKFYKWNYCGALVDTEADVFHNIYDWTYNEEFISTVGQGNIYRGMDCSNGSHDRWCYVEVYYDKQNRDLYLLNALFLPGPANNPNSVYIKMAEMIESVNTNGFLIYGDGAVPYNLNGVNNYLKFKNIRAVHQDRKENGVFWLQGLNHIYIDSHRNAEAWEEWNSYCYKLNKQDEVTNDFIDSGDTGYKGDHSIDGTRYALVDVIRRDDNK